MKLRKFFSYGTNKVFSSFIGEKTGQPPEDNSEVKLLYPGYVRMCVSSGPDGSDEEDDDDDEEDDEEDEDEAISEEVR